MINIDHFYVSVDNLDEAVLFYENILQKKITHREGDRWADFSEGDIVYFGIYNATTDKEKYQIGDSPTLCLKTNDIEAERVRISGYNPSEITEITTLTQPALYKYFWFKDPWGNKWEVAEYNY